MPATPSADSATLALADLSLNGAGFASRGGEAGGGCGSPTKRDGHSNVTGKQQIRAPGRTALKAKADVAGGAGGAGGCGAAAAGESVPGGPNESGKVMVVKDWEGDETLKKSKSTHSIARGDRYIANRELSKSLGPSSGPLLEGAGGEPLSTGACGDGDSSTSNSIAVANAVPTDVEGSATNLEEACNVDMGQRILSFSAAPPAPAPGATDLRTRYAATRPKTAVSSLVSGGRRKIPSTADKVLDAPGMFEDYYLNLLDWGEMNTLAVALQSAVYIWNASSGEVFQLCDLEGDPTKVGGGPEAYVSSLRWSQDGQHLAVGGDRGHIQLWDVGAQTRVRTVNKGADTVKPRVSVLAWDKDGTLNSGSANGVIAEYDLRGENPETRTLEGHAGEVCGLEWRADAALLASGGNDNVVNVWDRRTTVPKMTKTNHHAAVKAIAWCPWQSNLLASGGGSQDRHMHFWNTTTNSRVASVDTGSQVTSIRWSHEYRELVSSHGTAGPGATHVTGGLTVWSYPSLQRIADIPQAHDTRVLHTAMSPDHETIATVASDENLKFWKLFESRAAVGAKGAKNGSPAGGDAHGADARRAGSRALR